MFSWLIAHLVLLIYVWGRRTLALNNNYIIVEV